MSWHMWCLRHGLVCGRVVVAAHMRHWGHNLRIRVHSWRLAHPWLQWLLLHAVLGHAIGLIGRRHATHGTVHVRPHAVLVHVRRHSAILRNRVAIVVELTHLRMRSRRIHLRLLRVAPWRSVVARLHVSSLDYRLIKGWLGACKGSGLLWVATLVLTWGPSLSGIVQSDRLRQNE